MLIHGVREEREKEYISAIQMIGNQKQEAVDNIQTKWGLELTYMMGLLS